MELDLRLLRSFLVVAEVGHVGRAAERLTLTQPALTRQIQRLEASVEAPLFTRGPRGVALTEAGRVFAGEAQRLVTESSRALDRTRRAARGETGHIAIGFIASAAASPMTPLLRALRERHPGIAFTLTERRWRDALEGLRNREDDVAFVRDLPESSPWARLDLAVEPLCLVVRRDHPLAALESIDPDDVDSQEPFVSMREWLETHTARWPFTPRIGQEVDSAPAALALVRAGFGSALFSAGIAAGAGDLAVVPIAGQVSRVQLAWAAGAQRAAVGSFLALARASA